MKIYRVGGAVRDELLGYPHHETDWVVVGETPQAMIDAGYTQVGRDFPVFLHPKTKEEYALARTERKSGHGYHGFEVHAAPTVTLEEDLARRDLTINAMAMDDAGCLVDPYGGKADLNNRVLRHVSPHFAEDPLRVLRVARFAARYDHLDFGIAAETLALMTQLVDAGELAHLSIERVWVETERALGERNPEVYFATLKSCGALHALLPALVPSAGIDWLARAAPSTERTDCRWAALLAELPSKRAVEASEAIKAPNSYRELAAKVAEWRPQTKTALIDPEQTMALLESIDALRRDEPFLGFCETLAALEGQTPQEHPACQMLFAAQKAAKAISAGDVINRESVAEGDSNAADDVKQKLTGPEIGRAIRARRVAEIGKVLAVNSGED